MFTQKSFRRLSSIKFFLPALCIAVFILSQCSLPGPSTSDGWKEYRDSRFGYGVMIPAQWQVKAPPAAGQAATMNIMNYSGAQIIEKGLPDADWPEGTLKIDVVVIEDIVSGTQFSDVVQNYFLNPPYVLASITQNAKIGTSDAYTILFANTTDSTKSIKALGTWFSGNKIIAIFLSPERAWSYPGVQEIIGSMALSQSTKTLLPSVSGLKAQDPRLINQAILRLSAKAPVTRDAGDEVGDSPISPLYMPFEDGTTWTVGGWGSFYGDGAHKGNDYYATDWNKGTYSAPEDDYGQLVFPVAPGTVLEAKYDKNIGDGDTTAGYGNYVKIQHDAGVTTLYGHLSSVRVKTGDPVGINTIIGTVGSSGNSSGAHLHLSFKVNGISQYATAPSRRPSPMWTTNGFWKLRDYESATVSTSNASADTPAPTTPPTETQAPTAVPTGVPVVTSVPTTPPSETLAPTSVPTSVPVVTPVPPSVIVIDDGDSGFTLKGPSSYWTYATSTSYYYNHDMYWTYVNGSSVSNSAEWRPNLQVAGNYKVEAYITWDNATTTYAPYTIYYSGGSSVYHINQAIRSEEWVDLGTYNFASGTGGYVVITDATGEDPNSLLKIGIDAVRWTRQ
jgi:murein DD-endopeptidase MepM/ murein hydrolase activator NlpD